VEFFYPLASGIANCSLEEKVREPRRPAVAANGYLSQRQCVLSGNAGIGAAPRR
jgi:hypothetical protein